MPRRMGVEVVRMGRWIFIGFLFAHGLIHLAVWATPKNPKQPGPFNPSRSWLLGDAKGIAVGLAAIATLLFLVGGIGLLAHAGWWRAITVVAAGFSVALMTVFFNPWLFLGWGLSAGLIVGIVWLEWPSQTLVGA